MSIAPTEQEHSRPTTVQRHPVADLLTDEMRERVAAATFVPNQDDGWMACAQALNAAGIWCCPLGIALGDDFNFPVADEVIEALGLRQTPEREQIVQSFIDLVDTDQIAPEHVKPMLGVES